MVGIWTGSPISFCKAIERDSCHDEANGVGVVVLVNLRSHYRKKRFFLKFPSSLSQMGSVFYQ